MFTSQVILNRLAKAEKYFLDTKYKAIVERAQVLFNTGSYLKAEEHLNKLPTQEQLLESLTKRLKGKSVYKTLKNISEGKVKSRAQLQKGLFSLGTHIVIEVEKGNREYRALLPMIMEKLNSSVYED